MEEGWRRRRTGRHAGGPDGSAGRGGPDGLALLWAWRVVDGAGRGRTGQRVDGAAGEWAWRSGGVQTEAAVAGGEYVGERGRAGTKLPEGVVAGGRFFYRTCLRIVTQWHGG